MRRKAQSGAAAVAALVATAAVCVTLAAAPAATVEDAVISIEELLKSGWEIAGYASNLDSRTTFILFKKAGENSLVQCLVGYDVTRSPRVVRNCYRLK